MSNYGPNNLERDAGHAESKLRGDGLTLIISHRSAPRTDAV
jgi:hypothetical protein